MSSTNTSTTYEFDGSIHLRKDDIVRILSIIRDNSLSRPTRVTRMENFTAKVRSTSRLHNMGMDNEPVDLHDPIVGRVVESSISGNNVITFTLEEGGFGDLFS